MRKNRFRHLKKILRSKIIRIGHEKGSKNIQIGHEKTYAFDIKRFQKLQKGHKNSNNKNKIKVTINFNAQCESKVIFDSEENSKVQNIKL
jgi:hypothetical protein